MAAAFEAAPAALKKRARRRYTAASRSRLGGKQTMLAARPPVSTWDLAT
ncbi:MAG TPA: hypothetical protein VFG73_03000 [Rhodanobacteraceae bacterium]|nr:hypothetical protein [Rhodanobacteraceae bacterium]